MQEASAKSVKTSMSVPRVTEDAAIPPASTQLYDICLSEPRAEFILKDDLYYRAVINADPVILAILVKDELMVNASLSMFVPLDGTTARATSNANLQGTCRLCVCALKSDTSSEMECASRILTSMVTRMQQLMDV